MSFLWKARNAVARGYTMLYSLFRPVRKKALFTSFAGRQYSDNPRAVSEALHELCPDVEIVWHLEHPEAQYGLVPPYVRTFSDGRKLALRFYRELATSFCFVTNADLETDIFKRKRQFFVQTWHGDRAFKKILYDAWGDRKRPVPVMDDAYADIAVSGSDFGTGVYRTAFRYRGEVLECGSPRNDALLKQDAAASRAIRQRLGLGEKKLLLYAPTFRDRTAARQSINVDLARVLAVLKEKTGEDWLCMIRSHPGAQSLDPAGQSQVVDVSAYPDMTDLLLVTDFLLTDYSSSILDFYLTGRPSVCVAFDSAEYERGSRSFKVRPEDSGMVVAKTQQELEEILRTYGPEDYRRAYRRVDEVYGTKESGHASAAVAGAIAKHLRDTFGDR